jgi:hypothetical protein
VARRVSVGERRDTVFEYYEAMAYFSSSGEWLPGGQPEQQAGTFNGEIWKLAQALYLPGRQPTAPGSAAYQQALQYYLQRAIPPGYAWAWGASNLEQQVFADLIGESDAAFRSATRYLGFILANHITSAVDALITARDCGSWPARTCGWNRSPSARVVLSGWSWVSGSASESAPRDAASLTVPADAWYFPPSSLVIRVRS